MFAEHGSDFTTDELAQAAGVSEATVFRYFADKASLMAAARDAVLGLDTLLPEIEAAADLPTLIQRLAAAAHALSPRLERTARLLQNMDAGSPPPKDSIVALVAALAPLFEETEPGLDRDQLAGLFLGTMLTNAAVGAKAGVRPIPVDRLVDVILHGIAPHTAP